ncbi:MAG: sensor histidine kinase [Chloroflexi bacterium]|nr:sensor histidine kinase [Chloroflexota bacterium]
MSQPKLAVPRFFRSLRVKMALGVALPMLVLSQAMPVVHAWRERLLIDEQTRFIEAQLTAALTGSLHHAMLTNDRALMVDVLEHVISADGIQRVRILNLAGIASVDSNRAESTVGLAVGGGCDECHARPAVQRDAALTLSASNNVMRFVSPIRNQPDCAACHDPAAPHLGVLLTEVSTRTLDEHLASDLVSDFALALLISIALAVVAYLLLHWLLIRRLDRMREPLLKFADGDLTQRLPGGNDEIGELADTFNDMARQLEQSTRDQQARAKVRQRAIVEERERIARELHDGMAQVLGYVNTKAIAIRLLLKNQQIGQAEQNLQQLEDATRGLFVDVREAILGLKMTGQSGGLIGGLEEYAAQFSRLSDIPVKVTVAPEVRTLYLPPETELQLLRIAQEALTNIRKHASADRAEVSMQVIARQLAITISDEGRGFEPDRLRPDRDFSFGLATMRERAGAIGAEFYLNTRPGVGTTLTIRLPLTES